MKSGAMVGNGTDAPVEDVSPLASFYASVSRKLKDGKVFFPDQRMSREEALRSYTLNNAYAAFEEKLKGSLEAGKLADITVLSQDIMTIPEDEILSTDVVYTIVGGKVMFYERVNFRLILSALGLAVDTRVLISFELARFPSSHTGVNNGSQSRN